MSTATWYALFVCALWPVGFFALQRLCRPVGARKRLAAASVLAITWPLTLPALSFGSVAIVHLLRVRTSPAEEHGVVASPAATS